MDRCLVDLNRRMAGIGRRMAIDSSGPPALPRRLALIARRLAVAPRPLAFVAGWMAKPELLASDAKSIRPRTVAQASSLGAQPGRPCHDVRRVLHRKYVVTIIFTCPKLA